jgi:transposase
MLQIAPQMKILIAVEPADFRRGIDGLARLCQETLQHDPFAGAVFVFRNRKATALKLLMYDGQGFWLCHKRLSQGRFPWWPSAADGAAQRLAAHQLAVLLSAGDPTRTGAAVAVRGTAGLSGLGFDGYLQDRSRIAPLEPGWDATPASGKWPAKPLFGPPVAAGGETRWSSSKWTATDWRKSSAAPSDRSTRRTPS